MRELGPPPSKVVDFNHFLRNWLAKLWPNVKWNEPTLLNSWANVGSPYYDAAYYKDPWNRVHLRGRIDTGSSAAIAFQLPSGFRPSAQMDFAVDNGGSAAQVSVDSSGNVTPSYSGMSSDISLETVIFIAEA